MVYHGFFFQLHLKKLSILAFFCFFTFCEEMYHKKKKPDLHKDLFCGDNSSKEVGFLVNRN